MEMEVIRPIVTGAIGGALSLWLMHKWARFVPRSYQLKDADTLIAEYRISIAVANALFFGAILAGVYFFKSGRIPATSWQHFGLIAGVAILAPVAAIVLPVIGKGRMRIGEAICAFAVAERTPVPVLAVLILIGVVCIASALGGLSW